MQFEEVKELMLNFVGELDKKVDAGVPTLDLAILLGFLTFGLAADAVSSGVKLAPAIEKFTEYAQMVSKIEVPESN